MDGKMSRLPCFEIQCSQGENAKRRKGPLVGECVSEK